MASRPDGCGQPESEFLPEQKSIPLSLLTAIFLHGSLDHLAGNMLFLWVFGAHVEQRLGRGNFLGLYVIGGVLASLGFVALHRTSAEPLIGASGAIAVATCLPLNLSRTGSSAPPAVSHEPFRYDGIVSMSLQSRVRGR